MKKVKISKTKTEKNKRVRNGEKKKKIRQNIKAELKDSKKKKQVNG